MPPNFPRAPHSGFLRPAPRELSGSRSAFRPHEGPRRPALRTPEPSAREHPPRRWDLRGRQVCRAGRAGRARRTGRGLQRRGAGGSRRPAALTDREVGEQRGRAPRLLRQGPSRAGRGRGRGRAGRGCGAGAREGGRRGARRRRWPRAAPGALPAEPGRSGRAGARGRPESPPRGDRGTVAASPGPSP